MAVQHKDIPDAQLHEPKGVSTAATNQTYVANGAGSGSWSEPEPKGASGANSGDVYVANGAGSGVWRAIPEFTGAMVITNNAVGVAYTAAVDPTLATFSDYIQITGWSAGELDKLTFGTNALTIPVSGGGLYLVDFYCTIKSSINNTNYAIKFAVNGASGVSRRPQAPLSAAGTIYNLSANGLVRLNDGDVLTLYGASDKAATITIQDAALVFHKVGN